jgi:hypothetical protein
MIRSWKGPIDMSKDAKEAETKVTKAGAVELDEKELDDVAGGTVQSLSSAEQASTTQTADGKYVVKKLVGRPN